MEKKIVIKTAAIALAGVIAGGVAGGIIGYNMANNGAGSQLEQIFDHNEQLSFNNFFGNGISLTAYADEVATASAEAVILTFGNDYNSSFLDAVNRVSIQPYGINISSGVTLTANSGYQIGVYSISDISNPLGVTMLSSGWVSSYTTTTSGQYGIAIKKADDSDFDFNVDSMYASDYITSTDSSIWGGNSPIVPSEPAAGAQRLTATVTPANAINAVLDWSIRWSNPSSAWASGIKVTDYVTVTPTSDGALTADVECKQAFGEQVIVTANVRGYASIKATCTVDYKEKFRGIDFSLSNGSNGNLQLNYLNTDVTVDYLDMPLGSGDAWQENYDYWFIDYTKSTFNSTLYSSETYTLGLGDCSKMYKIAPTAEYLAALQAAGFNTTATAENYVSFTTSNLTFHKLYFTLFANSRVMTETQANSLLASLHSNSDKVMLKIQCIATYDGGLATEYDEVTTYNVKFSSNSTQAVTLANNVSVDKSGLVF